MLTSGKLEPTVKAVPKVSMDLSAKSGHVDISTGVVAATFLDDVINHCRNNRLQPWIGPLNKIRGCIINRQFLKVLESIEKLEVNDAFTCAVKLQLSAFFKKNESMPKASNIDEVTFRSFKDAEDLCMRQNILESYYKLNTNEDPHNFTVMKLRRRISDVLGPFSKFEKKLSNLVRFSQGATNCHSRPFSADYRKIFRSNEMSEECAVIARYVYQDSPEILRGLGHGAIEHNYSRIVTVPKNYKTKRTIAAEPTGHNPWQLAFDAYCKERLSAYGIDLMDQTPNQQLAFEGSCNGRYATIDLKQASDTIAYEVVKLLFPEDWFNYLDFVRTPKGLLPDGSMINFEKFSSMGNGSTFCIETIIFEAIAFTASRQSSDRLVYGDDIIVRTEYAKDTIDILSRFGFTTNSEKTHLNGPYRESCGEHYWNGIRVTPINFLRERYRIDDFYDLLNRWLYSFVSESYEGCTFKLSIGYMAKVSRTYDSNCLKFKSSSVRVHFVPPGSPATTGIRSPAVFKNVRLWRLSRKDDILYYRGVVSNPKVTKNKILGRYLVWLFKYSGKTEKRTDIFLKRDGSGKLLGCEPLERVTSCSSDVLTNMSYLKSKMLPCLWQVLLSPDRFHLLDVDWDAFRQKEQIRK